ncbi:sacsin N-terminal ATP-binding-like domain-containing protein [Modestobacter sp. I12A-02662]|uniref:sacsin N-terminal ATP-binding-like domain-containing protein n=1 Tax=Modestobacter sp. I12A-02662 TaxID=1730496 RepID=UPI0034DF851C
MADPAELRRRVLAAWTDSPARFREDANAEEDLVRGGYRDRLVVELAQNAADAAARAGAAGLLRLELRGTTLRAANTGAPLDDAGVQALCTLRASAKRDAERSVGRFGVGFAAVLAVSDEPAVVSTDRSVRFSADETRAAVAAVPALADELARRDGAVPVLRLPFATTGQPPHGFATEVVLPLRAGAVEVVREGLRALDAELLLTLPALAEIHVVDDGATRTLARDASGNTTLLTDGHLTTAWRVLTRSGDLPAELFADRPVEERDRRGYSLTWAVPVDDDGCAQPLTGRQVLHAPTPSDEPLSLPVRLVAPFPLGPDRRHVAPGRVTDALVGIAADAYAALLADLPADPALLRLVPRAGLAAAELDAALCRAVLARLTDTAWLPAADPADPPLRPGRAVALDDPAPERVAALTGVVPGLLPAGWSRRSDAAALGALGVRRIGPADVVDAVRGVQRPAGWWAALYTALADADRDELAALPVPLADGRMAQTPAGVLLTDDSLPAGRLAPLGLRIADPAAAAGSARRVLERLGARPATAAAVLADPDVRAAVESSLDRADDGEDAEPLAAAVLTLVAAAGPTPGELPWLAELALPDDDGGWAPAGELVLPGSPLAGVLERGALGTVDRRFARRFEPGALRAVGVLDTFALVTADDPDELDVDRVEEWVDAVLDRLPADAPPPGWPALTAVRDLELVRDWPRALPLLAALPGAARADLDLGGTTVPGYLRWWLRTSPVLGGRRPGRLRHPASTELQGLYEPAEELDATVLDLLRPPATLADVLADVDDATDLLDRLGDPARTVPPALLRTVYAQLAAALDGVDVDPPDRVRVAPDRVSADAVVLDAPWLQPLVDQPLVPAGGRPGAVADLLDLPLAGELAGRARVTSRPVRVLPWAEVPGARLAAARLGVLELTGEVGVHAELTVTGGRPVPWWPGGNGPDAVDGTPAAFGRALAWRAGAWPLRAALTEAFAQPDQEARLAAEDAVG